LSRAAPDSAYPALANKHYRNVTMADSTHLLISLFGEISEGDSVKQSPVSHSSRPRLATELRSSITRIGRLLGASMPKGDLSPTKLSALGILRRGGPMRASKLAARMGIRPQSLTRILADLEEARLLARARDPHDGREHILSVTPKAVSLMRDEGLRRDRLIDRKIGRILTPSEIELLQLSAKALNKLADGWVSADVASTISDEEKPV